LQTGLRAQLEEKYEAPVVAMNVEKMGEEEIAQILQKVLFEFPVTRIDVHMPKWLQTFAEEEKAVSELLSAVKAASSKIVKMRDCFVLENLFDEDSDYINPESIQLDPGTGKTQIFIDVKPSLFYRVLGETCGETIDGDLALMQYLKEVSGVKKAYDKVKEALQSAEESGYGIVYPDEAEYTLETPKLVKKGASYGVEFKAKASGYHIVKVDVRGEVSPIIGTKEQGEAFVQSTVQSYEEGQEKVWETNIFGKTLRELVGDDLAQKLGAMPVELRRKMRRVVTRVVNEGKNNLLCILF
jgi:stage IV sporulation protein A